MQLDCVMLCYTLLESVQSHERTQQGREKILLNFSTYICIVLVVCSMSGVEHKEKKKRTSMYESKYSVWSEKFYGRMIRQEVERTRNLQMGK